MKPFQALAAMSRNRVIGSGNRIPWHLPEDFRWFRSKTLGQAVLMGRKTFESIGRPLPDRLNLVLTRQSLAIPGVQVLHTLQELPAAAGDRQVYLCGGADLYRQLLPSCSDLFLSWIDREVEGDACFPEFESRFEPVGVLARFPEFEIRHFRNRQLQWPPPGLE